jgi:IclR helix-turn-helix domain
MQTPESDVISISLSPAQVDQVVRAAAHRAPPAVAELIADTLASPGGHNGQGGRRHTESQVAGGPRPPADPAALEDVDPRLSRSLVRGLSILTRFGPETRERGIVELAAELGMSPSTAHRYAQTLIQLGLLERSAATRKYRLPIR